MILQNPLGMIKRCLLAVALLCTVVAAFMPYAVEIWLCVAAVSLVGYVVCLLYGLKKKVRWFDVVVSGCACLSAILTITLMIERRLGLYFAIEALNLAVVAAASIQALIEKRGNRAALCVLTAICLLFAGFGAFSHIAYGRTVMSTVAEWVLASGKVPDEKVADTFKALTEAGETTPTVKTSDFHKKAEQKDFNGMPVLYVNQDADYERVVFYIHGGYYVYQMGGEQTALMNRLANKTNSLVVIPMYPLAPFHTVVENYQVMAALYRQVCEENAGKKIILMGDSAGGGYSLALAEGLTALDIRMPDELILLSPWVDVTMSNPDIAQYVSVDPMLTVTMGRTSGEAWAGELPMEYWHVSPINGDLSALKNVTIFVDTRELFYPDDTLWYEKLKGNPNVKLYVGKGQNHVYPVYPTLEGRMATETIMDIVKR